MTQHDQIISYLKSHPEGISMYEGFTVLKQTKINSRCGELEKEGYVFDKQWETSNGKRFLRYRLVSEPCHLVQEKTGQLIFV